MSYLANPTIYGARIDHGDPPWRLQRVLTNDPSLGIFRHADAGYEIAKQCAEEHNVKIPMRQDTNTEFHYARFGNRQRA